MVFTAHEPGNTRRCEAGLCDMAPGAQSGVCPTVLADGTPCDPSDPSKVCDNYAACFRGTCQIVNPATCD
jgi:hypothetical protein